MAEKVTTMRLKLDRQCEKCYKKVKKVLCKFPQIRDQVFDEKQNIITIKVVCCNPEKIRDKLCCKACGCIKSIEIVEPPDPNSPPSEPEKCKEPVISNTVNVAIGMCCSRCSEGRCGGACSQGCREPPSCCCRCSEGRPDGPCVEDCRRPRPCCGQCSKGRPCEPCFGGCGRPPPCYEGYFYARPVYDSYGGGRLCCVSRCDQYFSEDNITGCAIM